MRIIDVGQQANGFIAIGQEATGIIAIGQIATGVVAVGQLARGVFVLGQVALGVVSVGMLSGGLVYCIGMLGAGGRRGPSMLVIPLVPVPPKPGVPPPTKSVDEVRATGPGWVEAQVTQQGAEVVALAGQTPIALDGSLQALMRARAITGRVLLWLESAPAAAGATFRDALGGFVARKAMPFPQTLRQWLTPGRLGLSAVQLVGLLILTIVYCQYVVLPFGFLLVNNWQAFFTFGG